MSRLGELSPMEQLAIKQAIVDEIGDDIKTNKSGNLRAQVDEYVISAYESSRKIGLAPKTMDVSVLGSNVGTFSVRKVGGKEKTVYDLQDDGAFSAWLDSVDGQLASKWYADVNAQQFVAWYANQTGEIPDGVAVRKVTEPEKLGTTLRVRTDDVRSALMDTLPTVMAGLLGGDVDA